MKFASYLSCGNISSLLEILSSTKPKAVYVLASLQALCISSFMCMLFPFVFFYLQLGGQENEGKSEEAKTKVLAACEFGFPFQEEFQLALFETNKKEAFFLLLSGWVIPT